MIAIPLSVVLLAPEVGGEGGREREIYKGGREGGRREEGGEEGREKV